MATETTYPVLIRAPEGISQEAERLMNLYMAKLAKYGDQAADSPCLEKLREIWQQIAVATLPDNQPDLDVSDSAALPVRLSSDQRYALTHVDDLGLDLFDEMQDKAHRLLKELDVEKIIEERRRTRKGKYYRIPMNTLEHGGSIYDNDPDSIFTRYALQNPIVKIARDYFGCPIRLHNTEAHFDFPTNEGPISSQHWHYDGLDSYLIKFFTYLDDVTEETGALCVVDTELSRHLKHRITKMKDYSKRDMKRMAVVDRHVPGDRMHPLYGPKGTVAIGDPAMVLHRALHERTRPRYMFVACFTSPVPFEEWPMSPFKSSYANV